MKNVTSWFLASAALLCLVQTGCIRVKMDPIEINLNVKLQKVDAELDNFFGDIDQKATTIR